MAANASRHKPSPLFSDIQHNDISPSHPLRSSRALVPTECLLYGDPFISHTASLPPENTPVYAVTPQTQTQNSPNREREANGLYFSFLPVNRLVIYHGINMPDMFMKAVISRSKSFQRNPKAIKEDNSCYLKKPINNIPSSERCFLKACFVYS